MLEPGEAVPVVTVASADGDERPLQAYLDRPTVLVFVKSNCETTRMALPVYAAWRRHEPEVQTLVVSQETPEVTATLFADVDIDLPVVYDLPPYPASAAFDIPAVPSVFLALSGEIVFSGAGWYREAAAELAGRIAVLADEEPVLEGVEGLPVFRPG